MAMSDDARKLIAEGIADLDNRTRALGPGHFVEVAKGRRIFCDYCKSMGNITKARYDARGNDGRWAFACRSHFLSETRGMTGMGYGQRLIYHSA